MGMLPLTLVSIFIAKQQDEAESERQAKEMIEKLNAQIEILKEKGIKNIEKVEKVYSTIVKLYEKGSHDKVLSEGRKLLDVVEKLLAKEEKEEVVEKGKAEMERIAKEKLEECRRKWAESKARGITHPKIEEMLSEIEKRIEVMEYHEAERLADKLLKSIGVLEEEYEKAVNFVNEIAKLFEERQGLKSAFEGGIAEIKSLIAEGSYKEAVKRSTELFEKVRAAKYYLSALEREEKKIETTGEIYYERREEIPYLELRKKIAILSESGRYEDALALAASYSYMLQSYLTEGSNVLLEFDKLFKGTENYVESAARYYQIQISSVKERIEEGKRLEINTADAENLLADADKFWKERRYGDAFDNLLLSKSYIASAIENKLNAVISNVESFISNETIVSPEDAERFRERVKDAKQLIESKRYSEANALLDEIREEFISVRENVLNTMRKTLEKKVEAAEKYGIEVPGVKRLISIAEREIAKENFTAAVSHYKNAIDGINAVVVVELEKKLADGEKFAGFLKELPESAFLSKLSEIKSRKETEEPFELLHQAIELEKIFAADLNKLIEKKLQYFIRVENLKSIFQLDYQIPKIICTGYADAENCIRELESFIKDVNEKFKVAFEKLVDEGNRKLEMAIPEMDLSAEKALFNEMLRCISEAKWEKAFDLYEEFSKNLEKNVVEFVKKRVRDVLRPLNATALDVGLKGLTSREIATLIKNVSLENAKEVYKNILELEEMIEKELNAFLSEKLAKINTSVDIGVSIGLEVGETIRGKIEEANLAIQKKRYGDANTIIEEIKKVMAGSLTEFVNKEISAFSALVNSLQDKKIEIGEVRTYLNDAESLLRRNNVIKAHEKITQGQKLLTKILRDTTANMEKTLEKCLKAMELVGIEKKDLEEQAKSLEKFKSEEKFVEGVELLYKLIDEATDRLAPQWLNLYKLVDENLLAMEKASLSVGILRERLETSRMQISRNRVYEGLIEIANILAESEELMKNEALKMLDQLKYIAETGSKYGIEVLFESTKLQRIRQKIEEKKYLDAIRECYPLYRDYSKLFEKYLSDMQVAIHEGLKILANLNINTNRYAERVDTYQSYMSANDWKNALDYGTKLRNEIQDLIRNRVEELIGEISEKVRLLETRGEDTSKIRFMLDVGIEKLRQGDIQKALSATLSAKEGTDKTFVEKLRALEEYWNTIISVLEKYSPQPDMLEKLAMLKEREKVDPVLGLETDMELRKCLKEKMVAKARENAEKLLEIKKDFGEVRIDWEKIDAQIRSVSSKENFEVTDIQNIMTFVENLKLEIKIKLAKTIVEFENQLSLIEVDQKREDFRRIITKAKEYLDEGKIEDANREIAKVSSELRKVIEERVERRIGEAGRIIEALRILNLNFHVYENRYLDAKELLAREEYSKVLEILGNIIEQGNKEIQAYISGIDNEIIEAIETLKKLDINTAEIVEKHERLKQHAAANDFSSVAKTYWELKDQITKTMEENLLSAINQCDLLIEFAVGIGVDVSHPKELLNKGKIRFASKMYVQAKNLVTRALSAAEDAVKRYIGNELSLIGPLIEMLGLLGVQPEEHRNMLEEAKRKLEVRDYMGAQAVAVKLKKQVEDLLEENSSKMLLEIRECIEKGTQIGADTSLFERMYLTAQSFIKGKNYEGLVSVAKDAKNKFIEVTNEVFRTHIETFGKWLDILALHGISDENYVEMRTLAKNTFEAGNKIEAATIMKNAINDMEITVKDKILKTKEELEGKINFLRKYGVGLSHIEEAVKNVAMDVEKRDYIEARNHIELANKALNNTAEIKARELLSSLKEYIGKLKKAGVGVVDRSGEVEVLITAGKYLDAITTYEQIMAELNKTYAQHILAIVEETEGYIRTAGHLLASTENFIETVRQARSLVSTGNLDDALQIATQVRHHVISQIEGRITATISEAQGYFERFKSIGPEILSAAIVLNNASLSLSQKKYSEAYNLATTSITKIMESVREHTAREIEDYKSFIADCERIGIDVTKFREGVVRAEKLLRDNRVVETYYAIKETKKLGDESMSTYLASRMSDAIAKIDDAERLGVDTVKIIQLRNRVVTVQQSPNVLDALRELKNIEQDTINAAEEKVKEVYKNINEIFSYFSSAGLDLSGIDAMLQNVSQNIASKNLIDAMAILIEAESVIVERVERYIGTELGKWQKFITFLVKGHPETAALLEQIKKVQDLLVVKDYRKAHATLDELRNSIRKNVSEKLIPAIEARIQEIGELRKIGVDTSKVESMMRDALEAFRSGEYLRAKEIHESAVSQLEALLAAYSNNEIEVFSRNLDVAKMLGMDVGNYATLLLQIKNLISGGKYKEALLQVSTHQKELYEKLKALIEKNIAKCFEEMEAVSELNIDFSEANALLETAEMKIKYMDMMAAYQMVTRAKELIPSIVRNQITKEIELQLERGAKLRQRGIDISKHEHFLHKAKERLDAGKYSEAKFLVVRYMNSILPILEENFDKSIDYLKATINTAKVIGINVEGEEELWSEIKRKIATGDYIGANEVIEVFQSNLIAKIENAVKEELQKLAALLEVGGAYRCPVSPIKEGYATAQKEFQEKKYQNALKYAKENILQLEEILKERAGIELKNLEAEIKEYGTYGVETDIAEKILEEAKKRLSEKNYSLAFDSITQARRTLEQNATQYEKKVIVDIQKLIEIAAETKINIEQWVVLFNNGKELHNAGKLLEALVPLVNAKEKITQTIKNELRARIETMQSTVELGREMKIDVSEIERNIQYAQKALLINSFEEVHKNVTAATSKFVSLATTTLGAEISKVESLINIGDSVGCTLTHLRKDVMKAKEMVVNKEFGVAKKYIDDLAARAKSALAKHVVEEINRTRAIMNLAKRFKLEVSKQEEILNNSEEDVNNERYQEAYNHAIETKAYLVNSVVKFLNGEISSVNALFSVSSSIGVPGLAKARESIDESSKKLHEMDFEGAYARLDTARNIIIKSATEYLSAIVKDAENMVADAKSIEAPVTEDLYAKIENAMVNISQQRFREAKEIALEVYEKAANIAKDKIQERLNTLNSLLHLAKNFGVVVETASDTLKTISEMLAAKNFKGANKLCLDLTKKVSDLLQSYCETQILNTAKLVDLGESLGIKMIEIKRAVEGTWSLLRNKQYQDVVNLTTETQAKIHRMLDTFLMEGIQRIQNDIKYAESIGASPAKVKEMLESAQGKYREKDYISAHRILQDTESALGRVLARHISDSVSVARLTYDIGLKIGLDLKEINEKFKEIERLTNDKKFKEAYQVVVETRKNIISKIENYLNDIVNNVSQKIETASELGVDVTNARAMFEVAKNTFRGKDYLEAKKILGKIEENVDSLCRNNLLEEYERLLRTAEEFQGKNVDVSEVLSGLERVKSRIDRKLYVEAKLALETVRAKMRTLERIVKLGV